MITIKTTAIYPNRIRDKQKVESELGLKEFGDNTTEFFTTKFTKIFVGYSRCCFGDHGPYVEFSPEHLVGNIVNKFSTSTPKDAYYEWKTVRDSSDVKIYWQLRDVKNLKNPPKGGHRGNRKEGYADYKPGMFYVSPWVMFFKPNILETPLTKPVRNTIFEE
jgi:hypothetical protein